jgi:hypothetical protein
MPQRFFPIALPALAMSLGWGIRGDYGHEHGAMIPGALVALAVALVSHRPDWYARAPLLALLGAIGWAFGGQISYGLLIGYTGASDLPNVAYGFASLFLVGAIWGAIGCGVLALGFTRSRSWLDAFAGPLLTLYIAWWILNLFGITAQVESRISLYDSDWFPAAVALLVALACAAFLPRSRAACAWIATLTIGWFLGFITLTMLLGLHLSPPRSDNWSGALGLLLALVLLLIRTRNRAALVLVAWGALFGGLGFLLGDFVQMLFRARWGPIGLSSTLADLNGWKAMEQLFGLIMGAGVAWACDRLARSPLAPPAEDQPASLWDNLAPLFLLLPMFWENFHKNVHAWNEGGHIREGLFSIPPSTWILLSALLASALVLAAFLQHRRRPLPCLPSSPFGRAQLLFLILVWIPTLAALLQAFPSLGNRGTFFVHLSFAWSALACSAIALALPEAQTPGIASTPPPELLPHDPRWPLRGILAALLILPPLIIPAVAALSLATRSKSLPSSRERFPSAPPAPATNSPPPPVSPVVPAAPTGIILPRAPR